MRVLASKYCPHCQQHFLSRHAKAEIVEATLLSPIIEEPPKNVVPLPAPLPLPAAQKAAFEAQLGAMVKNLAKRVVPAAAHKACDQGHECWMCSATHPSRSQLFKHVRSAKHATVRPVASTELIHAIAHGDARKAIALVEVAAEGSGVTTAAIETGETPLQMACIAALLAKAKMGPGDSGLAANTPTTWIELIAALTCAGGDPFSRPAVSPACLGRTAGRKRPSASTETTVAALAQWGAEAHFRGAPAELAWVTADRDLCGVLFAAASAAQIAGLSSFTFIACPNAACKAGLFGGFGQRAHSVPAAITCAHCAVPFCTVCKLSADVHSGGNGSWLSCDEALCMELASKRSIGAADIEQLFGIGTTPSNAATTWAAALNGAATTWADAVAKTTHAKRIFAKLAVLQIDNSASVATRTAAVKALEKYAPDKVKVCSICDESFAAGPPVVACQQGMLRVSKALCSHGFCQECFQSWIGSNLGACKICIRCPEPECKVQLYSDDVKRIGTAAQHAQFMELITADYRVRLLEAYVSGDFEGVITDPQSRPCPKCRVILHRTSGCDDFICNCGNRFNFTRATWPTVAELEAEIGIGTAPT